MILLTPSHLIYGRRLTALPYSQTEGDIPDVIELSLSKLNDHVSRQQKLLQNFFSRWKSEYLTSLREHHYRGGVTTSAIKPGDVVQIHDDSKLVELALCRTLLEAETNSYVWPWCDVKITIVNVT